MIPGDLLSAFPHRQFHTLPGLLDSWAALPNSYPNALRAMQGGSLYHFYDGLWYDVVVPSSPYILVLNYIYYMYTWSSINLIIFNWWIILWPREQTIVKSDLICHVELKSNSDHYYNNVKNAMMKLMQYSISVISTKIAIKPDTTCAVTSL